MTVNLVAAGRQTTEMATVIVMAGLIFDSQPTRTLKPDMAVLLERTRDELPAIQQLWPRFEHLVGLRGRRMYAMVDIRAGTYAACTPAREGDDPARLGLDTATLPGGWYLRARITGEPPGLYERIGPAICLTRSPPPKQVCSLFVTTAGSAQGFHRVGLTGVMLTKLSSAARELRPQPCSQSTMPRTHGE